MMKRIVWGMVALWLALLPLTAKVNPKVAAAVSSEFPKAKIEATQLFLDKKEFAKVKAHAKAAVKSRIYRLYLVKMQGKKVGYGILIARKVRTKKATVLYVFDTKGTLRFAEIMAFGEPPEYIPNETWMGQFRAQPASKPLKMGQDIPTISGATLSARNISDGARIARAILQETVLKQ